MGLRERALHLHAAGVSNQASGAAWGSLCPVGRLERLAESGSERRYGLLTGSQSFSRPQAPYIVQCGSLQK